MDNVSEYYNTAGLSHSDKTEDKSCLHDSVFVSPTTLSLPVAKIIPLLSSQVMVAAGQQDVWLLHLQENPSVKVLGANVYESFCQTSPPPPSPSSTSHQSWTDWISATASAWF